MIMKRKTGHERMRLVLGMALGAMLSGTGCVAASREEAATPRPPLRGEFFGVDWPEGDCSYHGAVAGSNGRIYFSVSTHVTGESARLYEFDPASATVRLLCGLDQVVPVSGAVVQGKLHAPITEWRGELYTCSHTGWYHEHLTDPVSGREQLPYPGGYVFAVNPVDGQGRVVAPVRHDEPVTAVVGDLRIPMDGEGLIANIFDSQRGVMYVSTWPVAALVRVDVRNGETTLLGHPQSEGETVARGAPGYERVLRTLALDGDGNLYGANAKGGIWKYDPESGSFSTMRARMDSATRVPLPQAATHLNMWRTVVWNKRDKAFYGVHWATSWLFRYDPALDTIEALAPWRSDELRDADANPDYAQLGFTLGPDGRLYGFVHALPAKPNRRSAVHLLTFDPGRKQVMDHGPVESGDGRALIFAESCAVGKEGNVYTVGWVEAPGGMTGQLRKLRSQGPDETKDLPYLMALVRVRTAEVKESH